MKKLILFLLLSNTLAFGQSTFTLIYNGPDKIDSVDFFNLGQDKIFQGVFRDTLKISFATTTGDMYTVRYHFTDKIRSQQLWLDQGDITLSFSRKDKKLEIDTVLNAPLYYYTQTFWKDYSSIASKKDSLLLQGFLLEKMRENSANTFSLLVADLLTQQARKSPAMLGVVKNFLNNLSDDLKHNYVFESRMHELEVLMTKTTLDRSRFSYKDVDNISVVLKKSKAEFTIFDLWFTSCAPCIQQHKDVKLFAPKLAEKNVEIIGISIDQSYSRWKSYLEEHGYSWANYLVKDRQQSMVNEMAVFLFPTYIITDKNDKIIATYNSFDQIKNHFKLITETTTKH